MRRPSFHLATSRRLDWLDVARVVAFGVAFLAILVRPDTAPLAPVMVAAVLGAVVATLLPAAATVLDFTMAAVLLVLTGGLTSPFILVGAVGSASVGRSVGAFRGLIVGMLISVLAVGASWPVNLDDGLTPVLAPLALFVLAGAVADTVQRLTDARNTPLRRTHSILSGLRDIAEDTPALLRTRSVATAILSELQDAVDAADILILVPRSGLLVEVGRAGAHGSATLMLEPDVIPETARPGTSVHSQQDLPEPLREACTTGIVTITVLRDRGELVGIVVCSLAALPKRDTVARLDELGADATLAFLNARLFERVEELAATEERRRLADDLHDSVAQELASVRFELEFLARHGTGDEEAFRNEAARLAKIAARAHQDIRDAIHGLRTSADNGLVAALRQLIEELEGPTGPSLRLHTSGVIDLEPERATEVFRIVREAVSNAVRHARATQVDVSLRAHDEILDLSVEDDGVGIAPTALARDDALRSIRARSERLGARLQIGRHPDTGGTRLSLEIPVAAWAPPLAAAPTPTDLHRPEIPAPDLQEKPSWSAS